MGNTIEVSLPEELIERVDARVRERRSDRNREIEELIEKGFRLDEPPQANMSFAELFARASGPSDADRLDERELEDLIESEIKAHRVEKRLKAGG